MLYSLASGVLPGSSPNNPPHLPRTPGCQFPGSSVLHNQYRNDITRAGKVTQSEKCLLCKHEDMSVNPASPAGFGGMSLESQPWASRGRRIPGACWLTSLAESMIYRFINKVKSDGVIHLESSSDFCMCVQTCTQVSACIHEHTNTRK